MIDYQSVESSFYEANKRFIEECVEELTDFTFEGWCNAYGYEIEAKLKKKSCEFHVLLKKHQTTQNGIIVPINAHNNTELFIEVKGLSHSEKLAIGVNWFVSLVFGAKSTASSPLQKKLEDFSKEFNPNQLKLKNGTLSIQFFNTSHSPIEVITQLEKAIGAD